MCSEALMRAARSCGSWRPSTRQLLWLQLHGLMSSARILQALPMLAFRRCTMLSAADLQLLQGKYARPAACGSLSRMCLPYTLATGI